MKLHDQKKPNSRREASEAKKYNAVGFSVLALFYIIALFRSDFSWKISIMFIPPMVIIFYLCFLSPKKK